MRVTVILPPEPVIDLDEAKDHLRVSGNEEDAVIEGMVAAAFGAIDGPYGWLGRAIGVQTLEAIAGADEVRGLSAAYGFDLPCPPVIAVDTIEVLSDAGWSMVDQASYQLQGERVVWVAGFLPSADRMAGDSLRVRYRAGYAALPAPIRSAILLMVTDLYERRSGNGSAAAEALLRPYRVFR